MCQVIMKKHLRLVDNTIILSYKTLLCFLLICLYVFGTVQSYEENSLSMYLKIFFLPHVAAMEGNPCNSPERWSIIYATTMFRQAECKHVLIELKYKESITTVPPKKLPDRRHSVSSSSILFVSFKELFSRPPNLLQWHSLIAIQLTSLIDEFDNLFTFRPIFSSASFSSTF